MPGSVSVDRRGGSRDIGIVKTKETTAPGAKTSARQTAEARPSFFDATVENKPVEARPSFVDQVVAAAESLSDWGSELRKAGYDLAAAGARPGQTAHNFRAASVAARLAAEIFEAVATVDASWEEFARSERTRSRSLS